MSVHTFIKAKITNADDLTALLTASGIKWKRIKLYEKEHPYRQYYRSMEIVIGRERIWVSQFRPGLPFEFNSEGSQFATQENRKAVARLASIDDSADWDKIRADAARVKAELEAKREEKLRVARQEEAERKARAAAALRERQLAEEQELARAAADASNREAMARAVEEQRQRDLDAEAARIVTALGVGKPVGDAQAQPQGDAGPVADVLTPELEELVNKLNRAGARAKLLGAMDDLQRNFGLYLHSEATLEDQTIEITLRN